MTKVKTCFILIYTHVLLYIARYAEGIPDSIMKDHAGKNSCEEDELNFDTQFRNFLIPKLYTKHQVPLPTGRTTTPNDTESFPFGVGVGLVIETVQDIDEVEEKITLEVEFTLYWFDYKISEHTKGKFEGDEIRFFTLNPSIMDDIWQPDLIFEHMIQVSRPHILKKPASLRFQINTLSAATNTTNVLFQYSTKLLVTVNCEMDFHYYPADTQTCLIKIRSYSYFTAALRLHWISATFLDRKDPNYYLLIRNVEKYKKVAFTIGYQYYYDVLKLDVLARRKISYHLVQTYLPSIFFIVITWICFLIPSHMVDARIGISMTTLLTLTAMFASVRESSPVACYVKALDIWMEGCIFFVFLTLLQFSALVWLNSTVKKDLKKIEEENTPSSRKQVVLLYGYGSVSEATDIHKLTSRIKRMKGYAQFLEHNGFWIFLLIFIIFFALYWSWLLIASEYTIWSIDTHFNPDIEDGEK